jgi:magnesium and cobalt transporter
MLVVRPFGVIHFLLRPLVALVAWLASKLLRWTGGRVFTGHLFRSREEFRWVMQESVQGLSTDERTMINRVLDLQNVTAGQIAIPLSKAVTLPVETPVPEVLALCRDKGVSRLPVWKLEQDRQRIVGVLSLSSLLYQGESLEKRTAGEFVRSALYLSHDIRLEVALRQMQRTGQRMALVLGSDRREIGILTLEDILKTIFGEVRL